MTPPVNEFHAKLRDGNVHDGILLIKFEINVRGYDVVKSDPGVQAWVMENRSVLEPMARQGGLHMGTKGAT